jgi:glucose-6-phosphate isomerase, archaeal
VIELPTLLHIYVEELQMSVLENPISIDWVTGDLKGEPVQRSRKTLGQLCGLFQDEAARQSLDPQTLVYNVQYWRPVPEGTEGGLYWGTTTVEPGKVGEEYFMTHGHFHLARNRAEYYATLHGQGALIFRTENGETSHQIMSPGSVHYIPGNTAHRVANIGKTRLVFLASWPSDAGHDYGTIRESGLGVAMVEHLGKPTLVAC